MEQQIEFTMNNVEYLLIVVSTYYSIHIFFGEESPQKVFKVYTQKPSLVSSFDLDM